VGVLAAFITIATTSVSEAPSGIVPSRCLSGRGTGAAGNPVQGAPAIGTLSEAAAA